MQLQVFIYLHIQILTMSQSCFLIGYISVLLQVQFNQSQNASSHLSYVYIFIKCKSYMQ